MTQKAQDHSQLRDSAGKTNWILLPYHLVRFLVTFGGLCFIIAVGAALNLICCWWLPTSTLERWRSWGSGCCFSYLCWLLEKIANVTPEFYGIALLNFFIL